MNDPMKPEDKQFEVGGVFRCCIESLRLATLPTPCPTGTKVNCLYCRDGGMVWNGEVWIAAWRVVGVDLAAPGTTDRTVHHPKKP